MEEKNKTKKRPQVNSNCIWCWMCISIAPEAFEFDSEWMSKASRCDNYEWLWVDDAINACPVNAIKWI